MKKILVVGLSGESVFMSTDHFNETDETIQADSIHIEMLYVQSSRLSR